MANQSTLFKKPIFWVAIIGLGIAAFALTEPDATKPSATTKKLAKKKPVAKKSQVVFTDEDSKAEFKPVNDQARNAFVPIVARHTGIGSGDGLANAIPAEMTGGEANWVYTGTAETDGVRVALIENRTTGDAVFLKRGERWKSAYVISISEYSVILRGPSGTRTLGLVDETLQRTGSAVAQAGPQGFNPAQPTLPRNLRGPIGGNDFNGMTVSPDAGFSPAPPSEFVGNQPE